MTSLAKIFFWGYVLMLIGVGASGTLIARWELRTVFDVPLDGFTELVQATLLNQYRFLKAIELAFGIFCLVYRREIFDRTTMHRVFLAGLFAGVAARLGSWLIDGTPKPVFLMFAVLELVTGLLVWLVVARRRGATA